MSLQLIITQVVVEAVLLQQVERVVLVEAVMVHTVHQQQQQ